MVVTLVTFDLAFDRLIGHEGGLTVFAGDDGNWTGGRQGRGELKGTKFGIAAASYPHLDIRNLTLVEAKRIYKVDFWDVLEDAHPAIRYQLFDAAVNHGLGNAIRFLQRAVGVADDGHWGPVSQAALEAREHHDVLLVFLAERLEFWAKLKKFDDFGRGWVRRGAENLRLAAADN